MKEKNKNAKASLIKVWTFEGGSTREKVVYSGTLRGCKERIPPSKKDQFKIEFKKEA